MIGIIAGEIIGSPYRKENLPSSNDIFFPVFEDVTGVDPQTYRSFTRRADTGPLTEAVLDSGLATGDLTGVSYGSYGEYLAGAVVLGRRCRAEHLSEEDFSRVAEGYAELVPERERESLKRAIKVARDMASRPEDVRDIAAAGMSRDYHHEALSGLLKGFLAPSGQGTYVAGDGKRHDEYALDAALQAVSESRSWEEAVRRAVALGGDSSLVGALAGGFAQLGWGVPEGMSLRAGTFLDNHQRSALQSNEAYLKGLSSVEDRSVREAVSDALSEPVAVRVLSVPGRVRAYGLPDGGRREEMEDSLRRIHPDCVCLDMDGFDALVAKASRPLDRAGAPVSGTYIENEAPEVRLLWWNPLNGRLSTPSTVRAKGFGELEGRTLALSQFRELSKKVESLRDEQERAAGHDPAQGHLRFASAWHVGVERDRIVLYKGATAYGEYGIDPKGVLRVNTNVMGGSFGKEYLEAALDNRRVFYRNDGPAEILAKLQETCLDAGFIPDPEKPIKSNLELMQEDLTAAGSRLAQAAPVSYDLLPESTAKTRTRSDFGGRKEADGEGYVYADSGEVRTVSQIVRASLWKGAVFTAGHSNLSIDEFIANLKMNNITLVRDVRSWPHSQAMPQFDRKALEDSLSQAGIRYVYNGDVLGGSVRRTGFPSQAAGVTFRESEGGYAQRTRENASRTDLTLAFAADFNTPGELVTARAAKGRIVQQPLNGGMGPEQAADGIWDCLTDEERSRPLAINIAGNGASTFIKHGVRQPLVDSMVHDTLAILQTRGLKISRIVSGGQTGADEAGIKAAVALGIPAEVNAPQKWMMRGEDGQDVCSEHDFKARFAPMPSKYLSYEEMAATDAFRKTYDDIVQSARDGERQVLMCSETNPLACHRFACLGYALFHPNLVGRRFSPTVVQHIQRDGSLVSQEDLERRACVKSGMEYSDASLPVLMGRLCEANQAPKPAAPKQQYAARVTFKKNNYRKNNSNGAYKRFKH